MNNTLIEILDSLKGKEINKFKISNDSYNPFELSELKITIKPYSTKGYYLILDKNNNVILMFNVRNVDSFTTFVKNNKYRSIKFGNYEFNF